MRYSAVDADTLAAINNANSTYPGQRIKYQYLPRIRCHDCPGKLYTPGPAMTVDNFEVHLRNRQHRERLEERLARIAAENKAAGRHPDDNGDGSTAAATATATATATAS